MNKKGFLLIEVVFAISVIGLLVLGILSILILGQESTTRSVKRSDAWRYANEALEVVRNMPEDYVASFPDGTYDIALQNNTWQLISTGATLVGFDRSITLTTVDEDRRAVDVDVSWFTPGIGEGSVSVDGHVTNWRSIFNQARNLLLNFDFLDSNAGGQGNSQIVGIFMENTGIIDITLDKIDFDWPKEMSKLEEIMIDGQIVWKHNGVGSPDGKQDPPTSIDIEDVRMVPGEVTQINYLQWSKNINNVDITMTIHMKDETQQSVTFIVQGQG